MFNKIVKYTFAVFFGYILLLGISIFFVDVFNISESISYLIALTIVFVYSYFVNTKFVFRVEFSGGRLIRYVYFLIFSWLLNNFFFNVLNLYFEIYYVFAIFINIVVFGLFRFFIQKKFVFN